MSTQPKFKICLTMAGAVSAGAFTAGVMDYLLETLDIWEKTKQKNREIGIGNEGYDDSVPMHDVEIDVISGSSAGGITGTLTILNVTDSDFRYVNKDNKDGENNRYYGSWVEMADDERSNSFEKMLKNDDLKHLKKGAKPESLLNSGPIDAIAERALFIANRKKEYPSYISDSLDLILTTTNLRGLNFKIDFNRRGSKSDTQNNTGTVITTHAGFFRYKLTNESYKPGIPENDRLYYVLDLDNDKDVNHLKNATLSTAAFPIGLKSREITISSEYIERFPRYLFGDREGITPDINNEPFYTFNSIDGGLINNEPFGVGLKALKEKNSDLGKKYAVIMIDPFPIKDNEIESKNPGRDILSVAKGMLKSLRNQAMFNQDGILDALELNDRTKFLIEPVRKERNGAGLKRAENDLASAPFSGFAGFLDKSFRKHDFHLGRKNCQDFLRYYFALYEEDIVSRLGEAPDEKALDRFYFHESQFDRESPRLFPIIPDLRMEKVVEGKRNKSIFGSDSGLDYPEYPGISKETFRKKYKSLLTKRIELVANGLLSNFWLGLVNKLFVRKKIYNFVEKTLFDALDEAGLTRK